MHGPALQATIISLYSLVGIFGKLVLGWINDRFGVINSVSQVGLALGSLLVASIYDVSGSDTAAWILLAVASAATIIGWVGSAILSRKYKK